MQRQQVPLDEHARSNLEQSPDRCDQCHRHGRDGRKFVVRTPGERGRQSRQAEQQVRSEGHRCERSAEVDAGQDRFAAPGSPG